jgi:hypothetical protein
MMWFERLENSHAQQVFDRPGFGPDRCGLAVIAAGDNQDYDGRIFDQLESILDKEDFPHPFEGICSECWEEIEAYGGCKTGDFTVLMSDYIIHLNDDHRLPFKKISERIRAIELEYRVKIKGPDDEELVFAEKEEKELCLSSTK